jgi:hypothetical protein
MLLLPTDDEQKKKILKFLCCRPSSGAQEAGCLGAAGL